MNPVAQHVAALLERHPDPALRLSEILGPIQDRADRSLTADRLRRALAEHPETFRLLDPWRGPHRHGTPSPPVGPDGGRRGGATPGAESGPATDPGWDPAADVWAILLAHPNASPSDGNAPHRTLRETVRWLARHVDARSSLSVGRWYEIALAERESRRIIDRREAA